MERNENVRPDWQLRLLDERTDLLRKMKALDQKLDDPNSKMSCREWHLLEQQASAMREYYRILSERCRFYGLLDYEPCCHY